MGFHTLATDGSEKTTPSSSSITSTTTGNIDNLDFLNADLIRMNNASDATIRGLLAGVDGQRVTIVSIGAGQVNLAHQNTNSTAANRMINTATSGSTPLAAGKGSATYQYDATTARWRLIQHAQGAWISVSYTAGDFTASAGTWTVDSGDVVSFQYFLNQGSLSVNISVVTTSVSSTPFTLQVLIPNSFVASMDLRQVIITQDGGSAQGSGIMRSVSTDTIIRFYRDVAAATNWSTVTNTTSLAGSITFGVS